MLQGLGFSLEFAVRVVGRFNYLGWCLTSTPRREVHVGFNNCAAAAMLIINNTRNELCTSTTFIASFAVFSGVSRSCLALFCIVPVGDLCGCHK